MIEFCSQPYILLMKTVLVLKEIYAQGFRDLGNKIVKNYFKIFTWFSIAMFAIVLYAFLFRIFTGFAFD